MTAAIYFRGEAYSTAGPRLMGRNAAGEGFLRGYFLHAATDRLRVVCADRSHAEPFVAAARAAGRQEPVEVITHATLGGVAAAGVLFYPGATIVELANQRSLLGHDRFSLCGITHTTASATATDGITGYVTAPVQSWDAVICPSHAVKANIETLLDVQEEVLAARLGPITPVRPLLPVIPLGVHTADFARDEGARAAARTALALGDDAVVVLYVGRLSFHAKAHPLAMYSALDAAQARAGAGRRVVLIECGWFANDAIRDTFDAASRTLCPGVEVIRVDGRLAEKRAEAWAAADIFCSLADNIQETFGLTPIEAMAAGLPVVVSDWDGYRDTVRHGIDGFRVPTVLPAPGLGGDIAARFGLELDNYDHYCGYASSFVDVDIAAAAHAFATLFADPELRRRMGAAGIERARADYDWRTVIAAYEELWAEQDARRGALPVAPSLPHPWPARMDPYAAFASYPTHQLGLDMRVQLGTPDVPSARARLGSVMQLYMVNYAAAVLPDMADCERLIEACGVGPRAVGDVIALLPQERRAVGLRSLAWLAKIGVLALRTG